MAAAVGVTGLLRSVLVHVGPRDPVTFSVAPLLFVAVAMLACLVPALRATRVDPVSALRED